VIKLWTKGEKMDKKELMENTQGILQAQLSSAEQKIQMYEQQLRMSNQQFTRWLVHLTCEHGEETEPGVYKLEITESGLPNFGNSDVAFQIEPFEEEKRLVFCVLLSTSEKYAEMKKAQVEETQKQQAAKRPNLIVEK
jgi:hypothetical protein